MKWKAIYESEADVPAELKAYYHLSNGKWVFNFAEFEGLAELSNPTLNATKEDILKNKNEAIEARDEWKRKAEEAEKKLKDAEKPGMVFITKAENDDFEKYKALGTVKDVDAKIKEAESATGELSKVKTEKDIRILAEDTGTDPDALVDFKLNNSNGSDITLGKEKRKVKVGNKEVEKEVLVVIHEDEINGQKKQRTELFSEFATNKRLPKYLVDGIYQSTVVEEGKKKKEKTEFHVPDTSKKKVGGDDSEPKFLSAREKAKQNNESRNSRKLPWLTQGAEKKEGE